MANEARQRAGLIRAINTGRFPPELTHRDPAKCPPAEDRAEAGCCWGNQHLETISRLLTKRLKDKSEKEWEAIEDDLGMLAHVLSMQRIHTYSSWRKPMKNTVSLQEWTRSTSTKALGFALIPKMFIMLSIFLGKCLVVVCLVDTHHYHSLSSENLIYLY